MAKNRADKTCKLGAGSVACQVQLRKEYGLEIMPSKVVSLKTSAPPLFF